MARRETDLLGSAGFDPSLGSLSGDTIDAPCQTCEAKPTAAFSFTDVAPKLVGATRTTHAGTWCRDCARAVGRSTQNRTISRGWFGLTSWISTWKAIAGNATELRKAGSLTSNPAKRTMQPGRPVLLRPAPIGIALVTIFVAAAAYLIVSDATRDASDLSPGDCLALPANTVFVDTVETVSCDELHDIEVFAVGPLDIETADYSRWSRIERQAEDACYAAFADYVGQSWERSIFEVSYITPTREGWMWGEEDYQCLLGLSSGQKTGSAEGSGR